MDAIFLIVLGLFSVGLFLLLCFLPREIPLVFVVKMVWWCWILLIFACLSNFLFLHYIWRRVLLGRIFLVVGPSLSSHSIYHAILFWLIEFMLRNQLRAWWEFPCMLFVIFPLLLLIFYLRISFLSVWLLYGSVCSSLGLSCLGLSASQTYLTISFPMFGKFSAIIPSNIFSGPFSLSLLLLRPL